jgi:hypothetical protein
MWFRRKNMGYAKSLKNIDTWGSKYKKVGHMKVQVQKKKNDEHMKAHVLNSHVSKQ